MRKKIFRSIIIVAMTVLLASLTIAVSFLYNYFSNTQVEQLKGELALVSSTVEEAGSDYLKNLDSSIFRFTVVAEDGKVLMDTQADVQQMENHREREEIKEAFESGMGSSARYSSTLTEKTVYEAVRLNNGTVLRISVSQLTIGALILGMLPGISGIIIVAIVVAMLMSDGMARRITEPLNNLDLEHPVANDVYEEVAPLLTKVNRQHKQITQQMELLRQRADEFEHIVSSMNEGLVLLDADEKVLSMNPAAMRIFSVTECKVNCDFLTIDRSTEMGKAINDAFEGKHSELRMQKNGREYQFTISRVESANHILGALILGFDITEKAFAERNRQEFTANVSHELKTPLQSIVGSAELLESGLVKPEDTQRFIKNIRHDATRLVNLINDIIQLSRLDENSEAMKETVDVWEVTKEVIEVLTVAAAKKEVTLSMEGEPCTVCGVRRYIYEIVYNLCDNAIRYNVEDGTITIGIHKKMNGCLISVADTGIGVAPEHHARIFERFYRVDKSHSKETGGTGLGLAIVKHAVQYHGGSIDFDSTLGAGTTVRVTFP